MQQQAYKKNSPKLVELHKFQEHLPMPQPLPNGLSNRKIVRIVLDAQTDLWKKPRYRRFLRKLLESKLCSEILKNAFWFFFIEIIQEDLRETWGKKLFKLTSDSFAQLVMEQTENDLRIHKVLDVQTISFSATQDTFLVRYAQLLAQMLYYSFCHAFPHSQEKFGSKFRETILQTCSQWICGITVKPNSHDNWKLTELEPSGFRNKNKFVDEGDDPPKKIRRSTRINQPVISESTQRQSQRFRLSQMAGRRKTAAIPKEQYGNILRSLGQEKETPREYGFKKNRFNTYGLSQLLHQFFEESDQKDDRIKKCPPLVERTEIDPDYPAGVPLKNIITDSKRKVKKLKVKLRQDLTNQNKIIHQREVERNKKTAEMEEKIQKLLSSRTKIHKFATICLRDATARNPVPTSTILQILKSNGKSPLD